MGSTAPPNVAIVVPAYDEEERLPLVLDRLPKAARTVYVVDDGSSDATAAIAAAARDPRVVLLRHERNLGVGAAILTGYRRAFSDGHDAVGVMAGDGQMCPDDWERLLEPVLSGRADYAKGNRFLHPDRRRMPAQRRWAGWLLARLTNAVGGLSIDDSQCGYTVLGARAARRIDLSSLWPRYGYPNDLLLMLASAGLRIEEVPVAPVYAGERSGVRPRHALVVAGVILRRAVSERAPAVMAACPAAPRGCGARAREDRSDSS